MNSVLNNEAIHATSYQCFVNSSVPTYVGAYSKPVLDLCRSLEFQPVRGSDQQLASFGRVIPLLICGEQSAINVFGTTAKVEVNADMRLLRREFARIESEEAGHEVLWQTLFAQMPAPADLRLLRRRAALFFAGLGRAQSVGDHFAQVAQLDSAVGAIMWFLERSEIAHDDRVKQVATLIKRDEARHVSVSRQFAFGLGVSREKFEELGIKIRQELITLLEPIADSIEGIGIDAAAMFKRISKQ